MAYELPPLPYDYNALEPHIDEQTMRIHHDKHHNAYVTKANDALKDHADFAKLSVEDLLRGIDKLPDSIRTALRNNAGGHSNHSIFWKIMKPGGGGKPSGDLAKAIDSTFGSFDAFKEKLTAAAAGQFGSGWGWLTVDKGGKLQVAGYPNQDSPYMQNLTPLVGVDVWEHAYYLKYQNRRPDYLNAWWNVINWDEVAKRFAAAK
ncbi:MAG TPA: superoxide dismutase [Phycisphaerae bacterium]|nr:superoxide dismutase [Phycisphaerales bacterium]HRX83939.1 superoxide dismutase [Phycisphaerae bacterium]